MKKSQIRTPPEHRRSGKILSRMKEAPTETALLCRIEPLQSDGLPGRHGLKGIFEQQSVTALRAFFVGQEPVLNPHDKYDRKAEEVGKWQPKNEAREAANDLSGKHVAQQEH